MEKIYFYEKTGCINNTKQKKILTLAGYDFEAIDIINHNWSKEEIISFFKIIPVEEWFNTKSPRVKSGEIKPKEYSKEEALELMLNDHLLIRRPLIKIDNIHIVGFNMDLIESLVKVKSNKESEEYMKLMSQDLVTCPQEKNNLANCNEQK